MKPKSLLLLIIAGGCGLVAAFAAAKHLAGKPPVVVGPSIEQKSVVIAAADIAAGVTLKADMLKVVEMPTKDLPEGTYVSTAELTGQTLRYPVFKGEPVLVGKIGRGLAWLANDLPEGMKACTVQIPDEAGRGGGLINPGDHVDVYWLPTKPDLATVSVRLLLQDIRVLAVGERIESDDTETAENKSSKMKSAENYTLLLTPLQNKRLVAATGKGGKIRLVLRGKGDKTLEELDEKSLDIALGLNEPDEVAVEEPKVEPEQVPTYEVEYFKGNEISTEPVNVTVAPRSSATK